MESGKAGQDALLKKEKADLDRASKQTMKAIDAMTKTVIADQRAEIDMEKIRMSALEKVTQMENLDAKDRSFKLIDVISDLIKEEMKGESNANRE